MRDHLREQDIERRLGLTAGEVLVDVADDGTATVKLKRDHLDRIQWENHSECGDYDHHDLENSHSEGVSAGYRQALDDVKKLAGAA